MRLLIIHSHNANRGDEAAVKAMVDELLLKYPDAEIVISNNGSTKYPNMPQQVSQIDRFPKLRSRIAQLEFFIALATKGKIVFTRSGRTFMKSLLNADLVIHAPGGPSIGDIYLKAEKLYLWRLNLIRRLKIPYMLYAPSMGPFECEKRNKYRRKVLIGAEKIILRDPISYEYVKKLVPERKVLLAMDSALQHDIDEKKYEQVYDSYAELKAFLEKHKKCIGVTITDLSWHPIHKWTTDVSKIREAFHSFISRKIGEGYGIVFIPQLYGTGNDSKVMEEFMQAEHTFMVDATTEEYDSYFQQFLIGKLYAVVGMRYHSNIFSAKMRIPFISISYEQKMKGFMQAIGMEKYCIELKELSDEKLLNAFELLECDYDDYSGSLNDFHNEMKERAYLSTQAVIELLENKG